MSAQEAFDQLWAEMLASRILLMQTYGALMHAQKDPKGWKEFQRNMAHQSATMQMLPGHPDPIGMQTKVRAAIDRALDSLVAGHNRTDSVPK